MKIRLESGQVIQAPDDSTPEQIEAIVEDVAMRANPPSPKTSQEAPAAPTPTIGQRVKASVKDMVKTAATQIGQGLSFGFMDEGTDRIGAGMAAMAVDPANAKQIYRDILPEARAASQTELERQRNEHSIISTIGNVVGGAVTGGAAGTAVKAAFPAAGAGVQALRAKLGGGMGANMAIGAGAGVPAAAVYGAGSAPDGQAVQGATDPATLAFGAAGGAVAPPLARLVGNVATNTLGPLTQKVQALAARKSAARQEVERRLTSLPDLQQRIPAALERVATGDRMGVRNSLGELVDDDKIMRTVAALKEKPETAGRVQKFMDDREAAVPGAINTMIDDIDPVATADEAGSALIDAAQKKIDDLTAKMQAKGSPHFEDAKQDIIPTGSPILENSNVLRAIKAARAEFADEFPSPEIPKGPDGKPLSPSVVKALIASGQIKAGVPNENVGLLHAAKLHLDKLYADIEAGPASSWSQSRLRSISQATRDLVDTIERASPSYKLGMDVYRQMMPEIDALKAGRTGGLTRLRGTGPEKATEKLLQGSQTATRDLVANVGPDVARKAGAGELRRIQDANANNPLTFAQKVRKGSVESGDFRGKWQTILGDKYEDFSKKIDVIAQAAKGQAMTQGSRTAPMETEFRDLGRAANRGMSDADKLNSSDLLKPTSVIGKLGRRVVRAMQDPEAEAKFLNEMADYLLTPKGIELLKDLQKAKTPASKRIASNQLIKGIEQVGKADLGAGGGAAGASIAQTPLRVRVGTDPNINQTIDQE